MKNAFLRLGIALLGALSLSACHSEPELVEIPPGGIVLDEDLYLEWAEMPDELEFQHSTTVGDELEFKLEEKRAEGMVWQVAAYDLDQCRVWIDHDGEDLWPIRHDEAEIKIRPLIRGEFTVVLKCGPKTATIHVKSL